MKSSVCYPSHPSNDPFRCCVSVDEYDVPSSVSTQKGQFCSERLNTQPVPGSSAPNTFNQSLTRAHFIRHVRLNTPLLVKNYLPVCISLTIDNGGSTRIVSLKEVSFWCHAYILLSWFSFSFQFVIESYSQVGSASIFFVDPSNDLGITIDIQDYRSLTIKFPRAESFSTAAKSNGLKFSTTETVTFYSNLLNCMDFELYLFLKSLSTP